jgi:hypothetical protein
MWSLANGDTVSPTTVAPGGANRCRRPPAGARPGPRRNRASLVRPLICGAKTTPAPGRPPLPGSLPAGATHPLHRRRGGHPAGATRPRLLCPACLPDGMTHLRHQRQARLPDGATRRYHRRQADLPHGATRPRLLCPACLPDGATHSLHRRQTRLPDGEATRPPLPCPTCLTRGTGLRQPRSGGSQPSGRNRHTAHRTHPTDRRPALIRLSRRFVPCRRVDRGRLERPA